MPRKANISPASLAAPEAALQEKTISDHLRLEIDILESEVDGQAASAGDLSRPPKQTPAPLSVDDTSSPDTVSSEEATSEAPRLEIALLVRLEIVHQAPETDTSAESTGDDPDAPVRGPPAPPGDP